MLRILQNSVHHGQSPPLYLFILCVWVLCLNVCLCMACMPDACGGHEGIRSFGCELQCRHWESNLSPLEE